MKNPAIKSELISKAKAIFTNNLLNGYSAWAHQNFEFIAPAKKEYTFQWLWDTAFHAIVLSHFDVNWAKREIKNFLLAQYEDGFLPHIIFWGDRRVLPHWAYIESAISRRPKTTSLTQPPILPIAIEQIYSIDSDKEFLKETLPKMAKYLRWLLEQRDPDGDHLLSIISPNESGMDELPVFQIVSGYSGLRSVQLRYYYRKSDFLNHNYFYNSKVILEKDYFNVEELLFNCVFIEAARSTARLFREIENPLEADLFDSYAKKGEKSVLEKTWDEEDQIFYSLFSNSEIKARVKTVASLTPLFLDGLKGKKLNALVKKHLLNPKEFWLPYPVPSVAKSEPYFVPTEIPNSLISQTSLLWRGPTWMSTNWLIVKGLRKHGFKKEADSIVEKSLEMVERYGFREFYNPQTGEGYRRENFGWSTLILDMLE